MAQPREKPLSKISQADIAAASNRYMSADPMFRQGYAMIFDGDIEGKRVVEICCGEGDLASMIGRLGGAEVIAVDASSETIDIARAKNAGSPVRYVCGDVTDLDFLESNSCDVVVGQAAMHHLSHDLSGLAREIQRVLKPGGRAVFINEPMGHNAFVAAVRGVRNSRNHWLDEANLFVEALDIFGRPFNRREIYHFGLLSYFGKAIPNQMPLAGTLYRITNAFDQMLFRVFPSLAKYAANFNACFWK